MTVTLPEGTRFHTADDALAGRVRWALETIFQLSPAATTALLEDPDRRLLMRVADDGSLAGFVVFKDYKTVLLAADNAFIARDDKALLGAEGLAVYSFEQVWYRDQDFDMARIVRELLPAMAEILAQEATRHALLCLLPEGEATRPLRELLVELGFRANPNVYCDFAFPLAAVPLADETLPIPDGIDLRSFADPPELTAMARCFNRVFGAGDEVLSVAELEAMLALPSFSAELSHWVQRDGRVAAFIWIFRPDATTAKLNLLGSDPDYRGQGLVLSCTPRFMQTCQRAGIATLTFTIQGDNRAPLKIARQLGASERQRRQTYIRAV